MSDQALTTRETAECALAAIPANLAQMVIAAAQDPTTDPAKAREFLALLGEMQARDAEAEFNLAMARLKPKLPMIVKGGTVSRGERGGTMKFARLEDIDREIGPVCAEEGFSFSFDTEEQSGKTIYIGTLSHARGHRRTARLPLPPDTSGGKNALQAVGSAGSYARRYLKAMLVDLVFVDEDDDGKSFGFITDAQEKELVEMYRRLPVDAQKGFFRFMEVEDIAAITQPNFARAKEALRKKLSSVGGGQ